MKRYDYYVKILVVKMPCVVYDPPDFDGYLTYIYSYPSRCRNDRLETDSKET